jgi:membrane-associated protein
VPFDVVELVEWAGYIGLFIIVFAETGLLIGFFLPGDSLLIATGVVASKGHLEIEVLIPLLIVAAITGDATGYLIGKQAGARLFTREDSRFFKRQHVLRARAFYDKHGGKTIFLARFLAFIRTFAPTVAGAVQMPYRRFSFFNITGGIAWVVSMTLLGYTLGESVEHLPVNPELALLAVTGVIVAISIAPAAWHLVQDRRRAARARAIAPED